MLGLIETILWDNGYTLLDRHMDRLANSAAYFGFPADIPSIRQSLDALDLQTPQIVRLVLDANGHTITQKHLATIQQPLHFALSEHAVDSENELYQHKTTMRDFYDSERSRSGHPEVVFTNEQGQLTEGSWTNLFIEKTGKLLTPPVSCGLLPGTLRAELLATGKAEEALLTPADLQGNPVFLGNSVRGLMTAKLVVF